MGKLLRRLRYWFRSRQLDAELAEELEFHRALAGSPAMGNLTLARESARGVWIWPWLESLWQDLAYGFRAMRRRPGFTAIALLALGSAIGINTSLFTVFNAVALRPWSVNDPTRVVNLVRVILDGPRKGSSNEFSLAARRYLNDHAKTLAGVISMQNAEIKLDDRKLEQTAVSGNYFRVLGVQMERGRGFMDSEDRADDPQAVAVISHSLWRNQFGGDPEIVGRRIRLDGVPFTIIGVASRDFTGTSPLRVDLWTPFAAKLLLRPNDPNVMNFLTSPDYCCTPMAARLAPGVQRDQAQAEVRVLLSQSEKSGPHEEKSVTILTGTALADAPRDAKGRNAGTIVMLMFLAVTLVLLLACANVGNLLLARAAARRQEIAIRLSLGGSRVRLIRQLLVESMALALAAASIGLAIAWVLPSLVARQIVADDHSFQLTPDSRVLGYTIVLAVLACLAFGLAPALHGTRGNIAGALKNEMRLTGVRLSLRGFLLATQVAISVVLLSGAGLLVRGLQRAQAQDPGFEIRNVTVLPLDLPASGYGGNRTRAFARQLATTLSLATDLPPYGLSKDAPLERSTSSTSVRLPSEDDRKRKIVIFHEVSGGYFDVLRIPVLAGRNFIEQDAGRPVLVINETLAKQYWPAGNAIGKTLIWDQPSPSEIVGVVKDAYTTDLGSVRPTIYAPMSGRFAVPMVLLRDRSVAAIERVITIFKQIEPKAEVRPEPLSENLRRQLEPSLYAAALAGALGMLALLMASIGMSGVFAFVVRQRTREIGIRMALGAQPAQVVRLVLSSSGRALAAGLGVGLAGALGLSRLMVHQLNGVSPFDPFAYAAVFLLLIAAAAAASAVPARRAAKVDPVTALRWE